MTTSIDLLDERLQKAVGDRATTDPDRMGAYVRDQSLLTAAGRPAALVKAKTVDDVVAVMTVAHELAVPVVTRGAGTGLAGAANALDGCIVLSVAGMDRILEIDPAARTATVEPGVINGDLAEAAAQQGLWYVPDPGSRSISSIGGNLATNAGGICCAKYGVTGDHVAALTAVLADGRVIRTGALTRKNVAGLDLTHLLVGSEGTLAVIVEATMRLRTAPTAATTVVAFFDSAESAIDAVLAVSAVAEPCQMELMDDVTIGAVNRLTKMGLDESAGAMLLIQCDGRSRPPRQRTAPRRAKVPGPERFSTPTIRWKVKSSPPRAAWPCRLSRRWARYFSTTSRCRCRRCRPCWNAFVKRPIATASRSEPSVTPPTAISTRPSCSTLPNRVRRIVRAELSTTSLPAHWRWAERSAVNTVSGFSKRRTWRTWSARPNAK